MDHKIEIEKNSLNPRLWPMNPKRVNVNYEFPKFTSEDMKKLIRMVEFQINNEFLEEVEIETEKAISIHTKLEKVLRILENVE